MACPRFLFELDFDMYVTGTQDHWKPLGSEVLIVGAAGFDFACTVFRNTGNARVIPGSMLAAARLEGAGAATAAAGAYADSPSTVHNAIDLSATTNMMIAQLGVIGNLSAGSTPAWIAGRLRAEILQCAAMIGRRRIEVPAQADNTNATLSLLGRVSSSSAANLRAGLVIMGAKDIEFRFYVRGVNDPDAPGAWVALGAGFTPITDGNTAVCFADSSVSGVTPASYHQLEFAIAVRMKAGGAAPAGVLTVTAGLSYT